MAAGRPSSGSKIVVFLVVGLLLAGGIWLLIRLLGSVSSSEGGTRQVEYKVTGAGGMAYVTYVREDGSIFGPEKVSLPWKSRPLRFPAGTMVIVTAVGKAESGGVVCSILVNGKEVEKNTQDPSEDKATCGVILPK